MKIFDAKMDNIELIIAPESCLDFANQGVNESQTVLMDPDGRNNGSPPLPIFCKFPEAESIFGEKIEIPLDEPYPEPGSFNHSINYDQNEMQQLTALTKISPKCTQTLEFHCLSTPLKDLVS